MVLWVVYWLFLAGITLQCRYWKRDRDPCGLPCDPIRFTVLSCSTFILILRYVCQGDSGGSVFPLCVCVKLNVGQCRYGSVVPLCTVAILSTWFRHVYPPCSMLLTPALILQLKNCLCAHKGQRDALKIAPDNLRQAGFFCVVVLASAHKPSVLSRLKQLKN